MLNQRSRQGGPLGGRLYLQHITDGLARRPGDIEGEAVTLVPSLPTQTLVLGQVLVTNGAMEGEEVVSTIRSQRQTEIINIADTEVGSAHVDHKVPDSHPTQFLKLLQMCSHNAK